jgi:hypothetical protein
MLPAAMPDFCPHCGAQHPQDYLYCPKTGRPLERGVPAPPQRPLRWEYKTLVVPLNFSTERTEWPDAQHRMEQLILEALQHAGEEGWQAEAPTDWHSLHDSRAFQTTRGSAWHDLITWTEYKSVTLRLKRLVPP